MKMNQAPVILFVCRPRAAKSIIAEASFNRFTKKIESNLQAIARGMNPEPELTAQKLIAFCDLLSEYRQQAMIELRDLIAPVSQGDEKIRDGIVERIRQMLSS
jgi:hypothetical protein